VRKGSSRGVGCGKKGGSGWGNRVRMWEGRGGGTVEKYRTRGASFDGRIEHNHEENF
jgi:hypothetical protein